MNNLLKRLPTEKLSSQGKKRLFFYSLRTVYFVTSFVFGVQYLDLFWSSALSFTRLPQSTLTVICMVLGGVTSALMTTISYIFWQNIKLNSSHSIQQIKIASIGENISFITDTLFTIVSLLTFMLTFAPSTTQLIEYISVGSFVFITVLQIVLAHYHDSQSLDRKELIATNRINGLVRSNQIEQISTITENALREATAKQDDQLAMLQDDLTSQFFDRLTVSMGLTAIESNTAEPKRPAVSSATSKPKAKPKK